MIPYKDNPRIDHRRRQSERFYRRTGYRRPSERPEPLVLGNEATGTRIVVEEERLRHIPLQVVEQRDPLRIEITRQDRAGHQVQHTLSGDQVLIAFMLVLFILGTIIFLGVQP